MRCSLALILLIAVTLCESNYLTCQIFDSSKRFLQQYCDNYNGPLPGNCSSDINSTIDSSQLDHLKIGGCDPEIVLNLIKQFQKNLRSLDISYSRYENLDWFNFTLDQLQILNASHNGLSDFSLPLPLTFPKIIEIDLSYNYLPSANLDLREFSKLQKVHLAHNDLTYLDIRNFPLQSIEYIDLKNNHIELIRDAADEQYKNLKELHLEGNTFEAIDCQLLEGMFHGKLTSLFLTWQNVTRFWGNIGKCQKKRMRIVRINDTSEGIFITSNGAYEMRCNDKCFENVHYFAAGYNNFENGNDVIQNIASSIWSLDLSGNFIGELSASAFDRFTKIKSLELSGTNLKWFDFDMMRNQRNTLYHLDISNNNLKELHKIPSLQNYELRELILGGNQIENAYEIIEYLNPSIEYLDLSGGNFVGKVNVTTFQRLTRLEWLKLSKTKLILPDSNPFKMLQSLVLLDLSHNNLKSFNFTILSDTLYKLRELSLAACRIKDISTVIQYLGPNLSKLDLSENAALGSMNSLDFDLNLLKNQRKLKFLDISNNNLKTIDFKSFPFDSYIYINLECNDLQELKNIPKRHSEWQWAKLKLANNQFPCHYLKQLIKDFDTEIDLGVDSWKQKPDRDCRTATESINGFLTSVYNKIKFW